MPSIRARISDADYENLKEGFITLREALSENQRRRFDRYFCGVKDCRCGGVGRADIHFD